MNLLNYLLSSPVIPWVMLLLSASSLVLSVTFLVKTLILPLFSTLTKSQKASLKNCLKTLEDSSTSILPILSDALKTVLMKKNLLSTQSSELKEQQPQEQEQIQDPQPDALENFINFIKAFKEENNEKH